MKKLENNNINKLKKYQKRKFDKYKILNDYYIVNNEAYISVKVNSLNDIISKYSVTKDEILNEEFIRYVNINASYIPENYSLVLEICNHKFTESEKDTITKVIRIHYGLELIKVEDKLKSLRRKSRYFLYTGLVCFIAYLIIYHIQYTMIFIEFLSFVSGFSIWEFAEMRIFEEDEIKESIIESNKLSNMKIKFNENITE